MPGRRSDNDEERLPWLEPQRQAVPTKPRAPRRSRGGLIAVAGALAVLAAAGGGYWFGQRDPQLDQSPTDVALAPVAQAPVLQPAPAVVPPVVEEGPPVEVEPARTVEQVAESGPTELDRRAARERTARSAAMASARQKQVRAAQVRATQVRAAQKRVAEKRLAQNRAAQQRARAARTPPRAWPKMPSPGPAGQVIQLGAFRNPSGANRAYRTRLARYPVLGSMPRVVVPVVTKPSGQVLYVLRLGTSSRQQSRIVCRNLKVSGDHCLVIG